ncbi:hypothetical protein GCM10009609_50450 [Pseudonocardia aurantiaca]|uniref:DUF5995 family protein n=1 Tax=Pseudonocardia aurantiaca TaxID=75290 RepID=A0ABW4FR68_9PSEU
MIETIDHGAICMGEPAGNGGPGRSGPATPAGVVHALARLATGADAHRRGAGAGPVNRLLSALAGTVGGGRAHDPEFGGALVVELARRYLQAVRDHARGTAVPRVWQVVLDAWADPGAEPGRITLVGAHALVGHDLPPAVVSTCTLLGRTPGPAERGDLQATVALLAYLACDAAGRSADAATREEATGLELVLARGEPWRQAEHLWTVRGRPSETERDRDALDRRAALVVRGVLAAGS